MRDCRIGRHGYTRETLQSDIYNIGFPSLRKTEEIINYFQPKYYLTENPQSARMKDYINYKP